jgi:hypothetical protein
MSLVTVVAVKGAPGATTLALALGALWPGAAVPVVVELDPSGADLPARFGLDPARGLTSYVVACRQQGGSAGEVGVSLQGHVQQLPGGLTVCCGLPWPAAAAALDAELAVFVPRWADLPVPVIVDGGRLLAGAPGQQAALGEASAVVLVARSDRAQLLAVREALARGVVRSGRGVVAVRGTTEGRELSELLGCPVVALPEDARTAAMLRGEAGSRRRLVGSRLLRAIRPLARQLAQLREPQPAAAAAGVADPVVGVGRGR